MFLAGMEIDFHGLPPRAVRSLVTLIVICVAIFGLACGSAVMGMRPIADVQYGDFLLCAMDQIVQQATKLRYMSGGQLTAPIVVRSPGGTAHQLGSQHSARMEKVFMGIAGLRVVTPSSPRQAYGLLKSAVRCNDPVFINGYYRSGTTYLITLFSKDPSRGYISNIEAYLPSTFLGSPRITRWLISISLPEQRPMDNVVMSADEPTEDEYSIGAYEKYSIYET